jgi:hypothetical protein
MNKNKYAHRDAIVRVNGVEWYKLKEGKKYFLVSKDGRVARYNEYLLNGSIVLYKTRISNRGYVLADDKLVHRLVAKAWLPNPYLMETIDHIDADKTNNNVSNLQWLTRKENTRKAVYIEGKHIGRKPKPVKINGIKYISMNEAARALGINVGTIAGKVARAGKAEITYGI